MTLDEFIELTTDEQEQWLDDQLAAGLTPEDVYAALGTDKSGIGKVGVFYVPPKKKFMIKPMRGYQTTRLSGNEDAKAGIVVTDDVKIIEDKKGDYRRF